MEIAQHAGWGNHPREGAVGVERGQSSSAGGVLGMEACGVPIEFLTVVCGGGAGDDPPPNSVPWPCPCLCHSTAARAC